MYNYFGGKLLDDDEEIVIIDNNDRVSERVEQYREEAIKRQELRYQKMVDDFINNLEYDEEGKPLFEMDEEGYAIVPLDDDGHPLINLDEEGNIIQGDFENESYEGETSDEGESFSEEEIPNIEDMLEDARFQAQEIIDEATSQAEAIKAQYEEEAREEGYQAGLAQGIQEYQIKEQELDAKRQSLENEYRKMMEDIEKDLVEVICDVVGKVFLVEFGDSKEIIHHLVENAILNIENSNVFIVKVNEKNAEFLKENKENLQEKIGQESQLDIVIDPVMTDDQCIIETDGGVFDCGMDTQMNNLSKSLKALSLR